MNDTLGAIAHLIDDAVIQKEIDADDLRYLNDLMCGHLDELKRKACAEVASRITVGSKVKISENAALRPRYILGTEAVVVKVNKATALITLGEVSGGSGKFYTGQEIKCPLFALELREAS